MIMTLRPTQAHQPTTLERIQGLAALCSMAKTQLAPSDPQIAWEALVDAQASLEAAAEALVSRALVTARCTWCDGVDVDGGHLDGCRLGRGPSEVRYIDQARRGADRHDQRSNRGQA